MATTTTVKAPPKAAKKTTTRPAAKRPAKRRGKAAHQVDDAQAAPQKPASETDGPVLKMFRSSLDSIEKATTMVGESSLGSMAGFGIPHGATKSLIDTQAKAMHTVTGMTESVAKTASSFLGKGLSVCWPSPSSGDRPALNRARRATSGANPLRPTSRPGPHTPRAAPGQRTGGPAARTPGVVFRRWAPAYPTGTGGIVARPAANRSSLTSSSTIRPRR